MNADLKVTLGPRWQTDLTIPDVLLVGNRHRISRDRNVSSGCWLRFRSVLRSESALKVHGRLERHGRVTNVIAERIERLDIGLAVSSRDFR